LISLQLTSKHKPPPWHGNSKPYIFVKLKHPETGVFLV